jgi:Domain of unknown function (DUF6377)
MSIMAFNRILDFSNGLDFNLGFFFSYIFGALNVLSSVQTRMLPIIFLVLTFPLSTRSQERTRLQDSIPILLTRLDQVIESSQHYDSAKLQSIAKLKANLAATHPDDLPSLLEGYTTLLEAYKVFNYDSAFSFGRQLQATAVRIGDPTRILSARLRLDFCLLSAGLYKETLDSLAKIHIQGAPDTLQAEYYSLIGRYYYDLGDFDNDGYNTPDYIRKGNNYMDSALRLYPSGSFNYAYYTGLHRIKTGERNQALAVFWQILNRPDLTPHQLAVAASTLSDIYIYNGQADTAIILLIRAAIADIQSSTKETAAIFNLAQLLYKKGDVRNASSYIEVAIRDAIFYGARQRKVQVSAILPLIEGEKISRVEDQKTIFVTWSVIATILLLAVIALAIIVLRQVNRLKAAQRTITEAHIKEQAANQRLVEANSKLSEANKIKEEYIGYFFNADSESFDKIEKFKKALEQKIAYRKWDDVIALVNSTNLKKEKEELLRNFDKVFLKLFPDFIQRFNDMFREEDRIQLKDNELLNTDLRIFALIRMGIHETEKIARILEYSGNTINTYKTRIKNKSTVPNEAFELRIMEIRTY